MAFGPGNRPRTLSNGWPFCSLHGPDGERLVGFDNAHPVARRRRGAPRDHRHRPRTIRPYDYQDAATLLADFWLTVDAVLRETGVIP